MTSLHIDIETYCEVDLKKAGAYRYAEEAEIILLAYAYNDEPVSVVDLLAGEQIPPDVFFDFTNPKVIKKAFNAAFERSVMQAYFNITLPANQWQCAQARTAMCGLPLNLGQAAEVLNLDIQKDKNGAALIRYFCIPIKKPIKKNDFRERNLHLHDPVKWNQFKEYNKMDVEAERAIDRALSFYSISEFEHSQWQLDQKINERGVTVDIPFVRNAISLVNHYENGLLKEFRELTGIDKPSELGKLKTWLFEETGEEVDKLNKETIPEIIKSSGSDKISRALQIRKDSSKTSTKKYFRMIDAVCKDGRVRGLHEYYGANRTGRAAGRLLQHQNLPAGDLEDEVETARNVAMLNDPEWLEYLFGPIPNTLSSLIRSALVPAPGHRFIICDYTSIEAVVLAWLAGETWVLDLFRSEKKPKLYEATASQMFNVPLENIDKKSPYRKKGKVAVLACGYQGGVGALINMGALKEGLTEEELPAIVAKWREANSSIVGLWYCLQEAAIAALKTGQRVPVHAMRGRNGYTPPNLGIEFYVKGRSLFFKLPSGRELVYVSASLEEGEYGPKIVYYGIDQIKKRWTKLDTYGGKLTENLTQAVARDLLMNGLQNLDNAGYGIVLHVHDEAVCEMPVGVGSLEEVDRLMLTLPAWATGLPLKAAGEESFYYKK